MPASWEERCSRFKSHSVDNGVVAIENSSQKSTASTVIRCLSARDRHDSDPAIICPLKVDHAQTPSYAAKFKQRFHQIEDVSVPVIISIITTTVIVIFLPVIEVVLCIIVIVIFLIILVIVIF